jgi:hypothetical protein
MCARARRWRDVRARATEQRSGQSSVRSRTDREGAVGHSGLQQQRAEARLGALVDVQLLTDQRDERTRQALRSGDPATSAGVDPAIARWNRGGGTSRAYTPQVDRVARYASLFILVLFIVVAGRLHPRPATSEFLLGPKTLALTLLGHGPPYNDFVADFIGARAFLHGGDAYPLLGLAVRDLGVDWDVRHRSTHPPTVLLFALPLAELPWRHAAALWAVAMLGALVATGWALRLPRRAIVLLPLMLLWPPVTWSMLQMTPIWVLGLALAWRWRHSPYLAGVVLGVASLPKFFAAAGLLLFLRQRQWRALVGFAVVWTAALGLILVLNADTLRQYVLVNRLESPQQIARPDNGALLPSAWTTGGQLGLLFAVLLIACVVVLGLRLGAMTPSVWAVWVWLGVALLPIAWNYSLLPLLPWLVRVLRQGQPTARPLSALAIGASLVCFFPAVNSWAVTLSIVSAGAAFAVDAGCLCKSTELKRQLPCAAASRAGLG